MIAPALGRSDPRRARLLVLVAVIAVAVAWIGTARPGLWTVVVVAALTPLAIAGRGWTGRTVAVAALTTATIAASIDYLSWRVTVINWGAWWIAVPLVAAEAFGIAHAAGVLATVWPRGASGRASSTGSPTSPVFVLIPTVDEGAEIVRATISGAIRARAAYLEKHPDASVQIVVCNDGRVAGYPQWHDVEALARSLGVECVTRSVGGGAKAGNIEHTRDVLGVHGDALMVVFDADQVASRDFLNRTIPLMSDPDVAWVQTGQYYANTENPVTRWAEHQQAIFYRILCPGKSAANSAFICGTNVVIRAAALDEIGGFPQDSVTEDFSASVALHGRWRSVFVPGVLARGMGPLDLPSYLKQQHRWAVGTLGVMRKQLFSMLFGRNGLTLGQRLQYALASTHYLSGLKDLVFLVAPLVFLLTGIAAVRGATLSDFLWHFVPYFVIAQAGFWLIAAPHTSMRSLIIGFASFPTLISSLITVVTGRRVRFAVTSKRRGNRRSLTHLLPFVLAGTGSVAAAVVGIAQGRTGPAGTVSLIWVGWSLFLIGAVIHLGVLDLRGSKARRRPHSPSVQWRRFRIRCRAATRLLIGRRRRRVLASTLALAAAGTVVVVAGAAVSTPSTVTAEQSPVAQDPSALEWGVVVAGSEPRAPGAALNGAAPGIVARTQLISERFDRTWADSVRASGGTPWLTLQFNAAQPRTSGLVAIENGVFDEGLDRWAADIRAYGNPVLITVLPQTDAAWAVTSAVAGGGVPSDASRSWQHIRALFTRAGASNASFAWAPARADTDARFAPPDDTIDAVVVTELRLEGMPWPAVAAALDSSARSHPGAPLILLLGAVGASEEKADWLRTSLTAAADRADVAAVVYHDAAPGVADDSGTASWSASSDNASIAVMRWFLRSAHQSGRVSRDAVLSPEGSLR